MHKALNVVDLKFRAYTQFSIYGMFYYYIIDFTAVVNYDIELFFNALDAVNADNLFIKPPSLEPYI